MSRAIQIATEDNDAIAHFCRTCLRCNELDNLVGHTMTLAGQQAGLDAIALILTHEGNDAPSIRVAARGAVSPNVRNRIHAYCAHVIEDISGQNTSSGPIKMSQVNCSLPLHDVKILTEARILWSIYLGPAERPWGALAFFASRESGIDHQDLALLEGICPIVEETVERIVGASSKTRGSAIGLMATIRIDTKAPLGDLSIDASRAALVDEVLFKVSRNLPRGSGLARLGEDIIGILVQEEFTRFREQLSQTLSEVITNHEAAPSIRIEVDMAHTTSVEEASTRSVFPTPTNQSSVQRPGVIPVTAARTG
jgi:hypothetical protein